MIPLIGLVSGIELVQQFSNDSRVTGIAAFDPQRERHNSRPLPDDAPKISHVFSNQHIVAKQCSMHGEIKSLRSQGGWKVDCDAIDAEHLDPLLNHPFGRVY